MGSAGLKSSPLIFNHDDDLLIRQVKAEDNNVYCAPTLKKPLDIYLTSNASVSNDLLTKPYALIETSNHM